jgi:hypothetical protein
LAEFGPRGARERLARIGEQQFGGFARAGESDGAHAVTDQRGEQRGRLGVAGAARAARGIVDGRVPKHEVLLAGRRAIAADDFGVQARESPEQFARVGDGGGTGQKLRPGVVHRAHTPESAQDVGDVCAEHAPIDVRLVHDHKGEVAKERAPTRVVRQNPDVEHVGVGND